MKPSYLSSELQTSKLPAVLTLLGALLSGCSDNSDSSSAAAPAPSVGETVVSENCVKCHALGINGAPIIGNAKMWAPRVEQDLSVLVQHAIEGFGLMPAKGGKLELTDEQVTAAVTYMVEQLP